MYNVHQAVIVVLKGQQPFSCSLGVENLDAAIKEINSLMGKEGLFGGNEIFEVEGIAQEHINVDLPTGHIIIKFPPSKQVEQQ